MMNKQETREFVLKLLQFKKIEYFITGSYAYDVNTEKSDYDICLLSSNAPLIDNLISFVGAKDIETNYDGEGIKFEFNGVIFNFIKLTKKNYDEWLFATTVLVELCKKDIIKNKIKNKENRVKMFETFKDMSHELCY